MTGAWCRTTSRSAGRQVMPFCIMQRAYFASKRCAVNHCATLFTPCKVIWKSSPMGELCTGTSTKLSHAGMHVPMPPSHPFYHSSTTLQIPAPLHGRPADTFCSLVHWTTLATVLGQHLHSQLALRLTYRHPLPLWGLCIKDTPTFTSLAAGTGLILAWRMLL